MKQTIAETVREAQDVMARAWWHSFFEEARELIQEIDYVLGNKPRPITMPRSLGELCLDIFQNQLLVGKTLADRWGVDAKPFIASSTIPRELYELRQAMYHRRNNGL